MGEFALRKNSVDGLNGHCKKCLSAKNKQWKIDHPFEYLCSMMLAQAKRRARQYQREFNLDFEYIKSLAVSHCPVLGTRLLWEYSHGMGTGDHSPSLDRIDNTKGYIKGNVAIISHKANAMKKNFLITELRACLDYMANTELCIEKAKLRFKRPSSEKRKIPAVGYAKATEADIVKILKLNRQGLSCREIAKHVDLSKSTISSIIKKKQGMLH